MIEPSVYNISRMALTGPVPGKLAEKLSGLLEQARSGKEEAFSQIYELCFEKIYRFIYYRVSHKEVAEDLAEEVFIKAFHNLPSLTKSQSFESWLYQIARNQVIDYYRAKKIVIPLEEVENTLEYETNVVDIVNLENQQKIFLKLLKELSPEQQVVIKMKFLEDLPNIQIANILNKTEGAIRVIQHRALSKLKELINKLKDNEKH